MERVNYCLVCGTSETSSDLYRGVVRVNYYLNYGTSETLTTRSAAMPRVSYCLIYGTSETNGEVRTILQVVN